MYGLGNKPTVNLIIDKDIVSILSFDQLQLIKSSITFNKPISAPIKKGDKLGELKIIIPGKKDIKVPLIAEINVKQINPLFKIFAALKYLNFWNKSQMKFNRKLFISFEGPEASGKSTQIKLLSLYLKKIKFHI